MPQSSLQRMRALLFDLDGTLLDSLGAHFHVYERVFASLGMPLDTDSYQRNYSPNWYVFYERMHVPRDRWPAAGGRPNPGGCQSIAPRPGFGDLRRAIPGRARLKPGGVADAVRCRGVRGRHAAAKAEPRPVTARVGPGPGPRGRGSLCGGHGRRRADGEERRDIDSSNRRRFCVTADVAQGAAGFPL